MRKRSSLAILILAGILVCSSPVQAGFGISPPYVKTAKPIFAGSRFEQKITLLRSSADEELEAEISINAPEVETWVSINKGLVFDLPKGELQVPMIVQVDVPETAEIGNYKGYINIKIRPKGGQAGSGVAIALGARVDIDLTVTDEPFLDFKIRKVDIPAFEKLGKPWEWPLFSWFFYRIKVAMRIENTGNVKVAPTKVTLDVYDLAENEVLETHVDTSIEKVEPFDTKTVVASYPTKLDAGQYWGKVSIYSDNEIVHKDKIVIKIGEKGELENAPGLGIWPWLMLSAWILIIIFIISVLIRIKIWRHIYKVLYVLSWPLIFVWKKILAVLNSIKVAILRWLHRKTADSLNIDKKDKEEDIE